MENILNIPGVLLLRNIPLDVRQRLGLNTVTIRRTWVKIQRGLLIREGLIERRKHQRQQIVAPLGFDLEPDEEVDEENDETLLLLVRTPTHDDCFYLCTDSQAEEETMRLIQHIDSKVLAQIFRYPVSNWRENPDHVTAEFIDAEKPTLMRGLAKIELETMYPRYKSIRFKSVLAKEVNKNGSYTEMVTTEKYRKTIVHQRRVSVSVNATPFTAEAGTQTPLKYPNTTWTQYEFAYPETSPISDEFAKYYNDKLQTDIMQLLEEAFVHNSALNLYSLDYNSGAIPYRPAILLEHRLKMVFKDEQRCKDKLIQTFVEMNDGLFAVSYSDQAWRASKRQKVLQCALDVNLVLVWSRENPLQPRMLVDTLGHHVMALKFKDGYLLGGCTNGQVLVWSGNVDSGINLASDLNQNDYYLFASRLFNWPLNIATLKVIRPIAISSINFAHSNGIAAISWLNRQLLGIFHINTLQFFSVGIDGTLKLWNCPLEHMKSPQYESKWKSSKWDIIRKRIIPKAEAADDSRLYQLKPYYEAKLTGEPVSCAFISIDAGVSIVCGTFLGNLLLFEWNSRVHQFEQYWPRDNEIGLQHDGPIMTIEKHPQLNCVLLCIGGRAFSIWIISECPAQIKLVCSRMCKSPRIKYKDAKWINACGAVCLARSDGYLEFWDFAIQSNESLQTICVVNEEILEIQLDFSLKKELYITLYDTSGSLFIVELLNYQSTNLNLETCKRLFQHTSDVYCAWLLWIKERSKIDKETADLKFLEEQKFTQLLKLRHSRRIKTICDDRNIKIDKLSICQRETQYAIDTVLNQRNLMLDQELMLQVPVINARAEDLHLKKKRRGITRQAETMFKANLSWHLPQFVSVYRHQEEDDEDKGKRHALWQFSTDAQHTNLETGQNVAVYEQIQIESRAFIGENRFHTHQEYALWYILLTSLSWLAYFVLSDWPVNSWSASCTVLVSLMFIVFIVLVFTYSKFFASYMLSISIHVSIFLCVLSLLFVSLISSNFIIAKVYKRPDISPLGQFSICTEILLLIYTVMPLRLYISIFLGITYSVLFELLTYSFSEQDCDFVTISVRCIAHLCIHLIGLHILIMTNVRLRNTFMKVGQSLLVRRELECEKRLKEKMIESLMPPKVAQWLLNEDENLARSGMEPRNSNGGADSQDIQTLFRPFNMNRVENVSILFADIVGFTKMSSTKSAEELVEILNNLFQRFDLLCKFHNCEKISTLGDCYYCVCGCPEPQPDHAKCTVEMGLSMIQSIKQFGQERNEGVNIRVGVHTGTVLCGIVGTRRFKFDVWSNDVTLANRMESTGKPGMVHISENTYKFLPDRYIYEEGEQIFGLKTYFILSRKTERLPSYNGSLKGIAKPQPNSTSLQLVVSPPSSPPSISPHSRPRVLSCCDAPTASSLLKPQQLYNPSLLSPDSCKIKANSLPSILDSENEQEQDASEKKDEAIKTPTSTASSGRYSVKLKNWKVPKFLRKGSEAAGGKQECVISPDCPSRSSTGDDTAFSNPRESITGYTQIPMIIETKNDNPSLVAGVDNELNIPAPTGIYLDEPKDYIDVKSYISQSRSDVGQFDYSPNEFSHFIRAGSYRSQYGRSPNEYSFLSRAGSNRSKRERSPINDLLPSERARSATVTVGQLERNKKNSLDVPPGGRTSSTIVDDQISTGPSVNSRKDSGIKSNSRRSSIMQVDHHHPLPVTSDSLHHHRVSGYFTSSQSSINSPQFSSCVPGPIPAKYKIQNLRKQSDRQLIRCVQDNSKSRRSYFIKPPLRSLSLFFCNERIEHDYRANVHSMHNPSDSLPTLANATLNTYFDIFVSALTFFIVSFGLFLLYRPEPAWIGVFSAFVLMQLCAIAICFKRVCFLCDYYFRFVSKWYRWNAFGIVLVSVPLVSVLINFNCYQIPQEHPLATGNYLYGFLLFVGLIHFCNFIQLNCWLKNLFATIYCLCFIGCIWNCPLGDQNLNSSTHEVNNGSQIAEHFRNHSVFSSFQHVTGTNKSEILMDLLLLLVLVWILNREFEICYRLSFHANYVANRDRAHVQSLKNQADWLIYHIVPEHVVESLKKNAKYSENFDNVAIIFASIVNFNEMYDESYLGGKEFLRVLNELIGDFDELLTLPQFQSVEKIKTIGSTFMAASGLNSDMRKQQKDKNDHLFALMDFAIAMQEVVDNFNRNLLEFNLILRIGYNFGDVTAAVIGKTKLYYDIWGDAVNVASRMDSTGVNDRIQVGEHCLEILRQRYDFEPRGSVYVKGKDNMNVYLFLPQQYEDMEATRTSE